MAAEPKGLVIALGAAKPKGGGESEVESEGGSSLTAAKALLAAIKAGDAKAVDEALSLHRELCMGGEYEDD